MHRLPMPRGADGLVAGGAVGAAALAAVLATRLGGAPVLGAAVALLIAAAVLVGFVVRPHVMVAGFVAYVILLPAVRLAVGPWIGASKDVLVGLAVVGVAIASRRAGARPPDPVVLGAAAMLAVLYLADLGGAHDLAWFQQTRLTLEVLALLVVGMSLPEPRRVLRWAVASLVATGAAVAVWGLVQQVLGVSGLLALGYTYGESVRNFGPFLRSFGTLDDPFAYAAVLLFALAAVALWMRPGPLAGGLGLLLLLGVAASLVRTAALVVVVLGALMLLRRRHPAPALALIAACSVAALALLAFPTGAQTERSVAVGRTNVTLNGRTDAWRAALGDPRDWVLGQGVGEIGTGAQRAAQGLVGDTGPSAVGRRASVSVDSGYLATVADVGLVGLAVLTVLIARIGSVLWTGARQGGREAGFGLGILAVILIDALTRSSFTGFPTAFVGMLLIGLVVAVVREPAPGRPEEAAVRTAST
jgi:O-antigen ligase